MTTVHPIRLPICNVFLVKGARPILVDTGRPKDAGVIEAALRQQGVRLSDLTLLLHTHGHWDHCGSSAQFHEHTSAPLAIHAADADMMRRGDNGRLTPTCWTARLLKPLLDRSYPGVEPTLLIEQDMDLAAYGVSARVLHTPGHTRGSISILTDQGEGLVGDLLMGGFLGGKLLRHRPGLHYFAEDLPTLRQSVRRLLDLKPRILHTGHGGPLDPRRIPVRLWGENG